MAAKKKAEAETKAEAEEVVCEAVPEAAEKEVPAEQEAKAEKKYPVDNLRKNARALFGVGNCVFAGATAGLTGEYTVDEMKNIIKEWCGKEAR